MPRSTFVRVTLRKLLRIGTPASGTVLFPMSRTEHLLKEIDSCHKSAQSASASSARCRRETSQFESRPTRTYIITSSANSLTETPNSSKMLIRSFMNITNITGPILLHWMTPEKRFAGSDNDEFILVWWLRSQKKTGKPWQKFAAYTIGIQFDKQPVVRNIINGFSKVYTIQ